MIKEFEGENNMKISMKGQGSVKEIRECGLLSTLKEYNLVVEE